MSMEKLVYLRKDAELAYLYNGELGSVSKIYFDDGFPRTYKDHSARSKLTDAITEYLADDKMFSECLIAFPAEVTNHQFELSVEIDASCAKKLCEILPDPLLQVRGCLADSMTAVLLPGFVEHAIFTKPVDQCVKVSELVSTADTNGQGTGNRAPLRQLLVSIPSIQLDLELINSLNLTFSLSLTWREPEPILIQGNTNSTLLQLYGKDSSKDLTFVTGDGGEVKCHRVIFEVHSPVLEAMLSPSNGMKEFQTGRIEMNENSEQGMKYLVMYFYGIQFDALELSCDIAVELFRTAHKYELKEVEVAMEKLLVQKETEWFTPDGLLELYFHSRNLDKLAHLNSKCLQIMICMPGQLKSCERYKELHQAEFEHLFWDTARILTGRMII